MSQLITCTHTSEYNLTRGAHYTLLAQDAEDKQVLVRDDNGRCHWFPGYLFDLQGRPVPVLAAWRYDDPVDDPLNGWDETNNWVDIRLKFDDETQRWCQMATPDYIKGLLEQRRPHEPMVYAKNLIVVRDLKEETVEQVLTEMDRQNELLDYSFPLPSEEQAEEEEETEE